MAKKVRKPRSASPRTYGQADLQPVLPASPVVAAPQPAPKPAAPAVSPPAQRSSKVVDLRAEYPYVSKDLTRLGITAAAMFAVLVVLNGVLGLVR